SKVIVLLIVCLLLPSLIAPSAYAAPYEGYNYSYWDKAEPSAIAYLPKVVLDGRGEDYGVLNSPEDVYVRGDKIYILDSGNNRIVILDKNYDFVSQIDSFNNNGQSDTFNHPQGIYVTENNHIY